MFESSREPVQSDYNDGRVDGDDATSTCEEEYTGLHHEYSVEEFLGDCSPVAMC
jgi:hypothetical protein